MSAQCYADECERDAYSRGMCLMHYKRWRKYGDPNVRKVTPCNLSADEILRTKGWDVTESDCWEFNGWTNGRMQYRELSLNGNDEKAHRVAYEAWVGPIPEGLIVRHKCDNPPCINPDHLELGTHADNAHDRDSRGRHGFRKTRGRLNGNAILRESDVIEIRKRLADYGGRQRELAEEFGISVSHISTIKNRKAWKHI